MYNSPLQLFQTEPILQELKDRVDDYVYTCVQQVGVNIDKAELIKALNYDRGQYEKGFADGVESCREQVEKLKMQLTRMADELRPRPPWSEWPGVDR